MTAHSSDVWTLGIDDILGYTIAASTTANLDRDYMVFAESELDNTSTPSTQASSFAHQSLPSRASSFTPSDADSPGLASPHGERASHAGAHMQLVWPADNQSATAARPVIPDQHHEKSCPRCTLTEAEARKCRLDRRREQNRESQRKFRARKEAKIRESASQVAALESYVQFLEQHNNELEGCNAELQQQIARMDHGPHGNSVQRSNAAKTELRVESAEIWSHESPLLGIQPSTQGTNPINPCPNVHPSLLDHELLPAYYPQGSHQ